MLHREVATDSQASGSSWRSFRAFIGSSKFSTHYDFLIKHVFFLPIMYFSAAILGEGEGWEN